MATTMELPAEELERMQFFEQARARAEQDHKANPSDAQVLTRWGGALLELAHFKQGPEAAQMIELAVSKFEAAPAINPKKHDALWCLGNALTSQGFLFQEAERADSSTKPRRVSSARSTRSPRTRSTRRWR